MNIHLWTRTRNRVVNTGPWSAWSEWSEKTPIFGIRARVRHRTITTTWQEQEIHSTCGICAGPEGYVWGIGGFTTPWANKNTVETETETQYRYFDPPKNLPDWACTAGPSFMPQDKFRFESAWLRRVPGVKAYTAEIDLDPHDGRRYVTGAELGVGHHAFIFTAELGKGQTSSHQLHFDVLPPIEMAFLEPEFAVKLDPAFKAKPGGGKFENGGSVTLEIRNNSRDDAHVFLRPISVPRAWQAIVLKAVVPVKAGKAARVKVQIEMMEQGGVAKATHLPVAIEGRIAAADFSTSATCYVRPVLGSNYKRAAHSLHAKRRQNKLR